MPHQLAPLAARKQRRHCFEPELWLYDYSNRPRPDPTRPADQTHPYTPYPSHIHVTKPKSVNPITCSSAGIFCDMFHNCGSVERLSFSRADSAEKGGQGCKSYRTSNKITSLRFLKKKEKKCKGISLYSLSGTSNHIPYQIPNISVRTNVYI